MKNVLFMVYYFPPLGGSGVQRPLKFLKYLRDFGWNPVVICPEPGAYPYYDPSLVDELENLSLEIHRVEASTPFHLPFLRNEKVNFPEKLTEIVRRISRLSMYPDNKKGWIEPAIKKAMDLSQNRSFDLIFSTAPPFSDHIAASELKKKLNIPLVLDYRDAWTNNHFMDGLFEWQKTIHNRLEKTCLNNANHIIVLDKNMETLIREAHPDIPLNTSVITHGFDPDDFNGTVEPTLEYKSKKLNLLYSGLFYECNQPDVFLKALKELVQESKISREDFHLHFQGGLTPRIKDYVNDLDMGNSVTDYGYITHSRAVANVQKADALWMISNFNPVHKQVKSGKLFEYMGSKKPILGLVHSGSESEALKHYEAGYIAKPDDIEAVKKTVLSLIVDWKGKNLKSASKRYIQQFDRRKLTKELAVVFNTLSSQ